MGTGAVGAEVDGTGVGAPGDAGVDGVRVGAGVDGEGEGDGDDNNKKDTGKSAAERFAEIRQKISEYLEDIENKHNDKLKEIYSLRNELIANEGEKELDSIRRQRDQQMMENDKWLQDIAKKTRELEKFKHINGCCNVLI